MEWEVRLIGWMQSGPGGMDVFEKVMDFFSGETGLMLLVLVVMFCWRKEAGQKIALIGVSVNVWLPMIKSVVCRPRPYMGHPDRVKARVLVEKSASAQNVAAQGYSFPSMHSASVPTLYFSLAKEAKKKWLWIAASCLTLLVGISRVGAGMHYPTDVIAGWALGFAVIGVYALLDRYVHKEWLYYTILIVSALPGIFYVRTNDYFTSLGCLIGVIAAINFERRHVNYQDTRKIPAMILRVLGAVLIYFVVNTLLKLPFDKEYLAGASLGALLVRSARYAVVMFLLAGVYPMIFPLYERIGN